MSHDPCGTPVSALLSQGLEAFAENVHKVLVEQGIGALRTNSLVRLTAGASYQTWSFDVDTPAGPLPLILRRMPDDAPTEDIQIGPEAEAMVIRQVAAVGVPVPLVHHVLTPMDGLGRGFIAARLEGETLAGRILRSERFAGLRPRLAHLCGQALARIHVTPLAALPPLPQRSTQERLVALYDEYRRVSARRPVFEWAFAWLREHCPPESQSLRLVHGDFRNGNLMLDEHGIVAVLDWELAHLGDPAEDLGWLTVNSWRFGQREWPVGGFGTVAQLLEGYRESGGPPVDESDVLFWRAFGSLQWGMMCQQMARPLQAGSSIHVERAMIGRRVSETELDLLDLWDEWEA